MTAQFPDWLVYRGRKRSLHSNPLEQYWNDERPRPDIQPQSTACWRGYVASWIVKHEHLYLTDIQIPSGGDGLQLSTLFPNEATPIAATWFTGLLHIPDGEQLRYVHMGYASIYAVETELRVWQGRIVLEDEYDNRRKQRVKRDTTVVLDQLYGEEEAAFLRAIYTSPADDAPRLIYADWLDDHSDPRAAALRAYIADRNTKSLDATNSAEARHDLHAGWLWWQLLTYPK